MAAGSATLPTTYGVISSWRGGRIPSIPVTVPERLMNPCCSRVQLDQAVRWPRL